jgi:hypothetical protein
MSISGFRGRERKVKRTLVDSRDVPRHTRLLQPIHTQIKLLLLSREVNSNHRSTIRPLIDVVLPFFLIFGFFGVGTGGGTFATVTCDEGVLGGRKGAKEGGGRDDVPPQTEECLRCRRPPPPRPSSMRCLRTRTESCVGGGKSEFVVSIHSRSDSTTVRRTARSKVSWRKRRGRRGR